MLLPKDLDYVESQLRGTNGNDRVQKQPQDWRGTYAEVDDLKLKHYAETVILLTRIFFLIIHKHAFFNNLLLLLHQILFTDSLFLFLLSLLWLFIEILIPNNPKTM